MKKIKNTDYEQNLKIRVARVTNNVARIYFVDGGGLPVAPPPNTILREVPDNDDQLPLNGSFFYDLDWQLRIVP